jgi:superoxide dismutase, Fe-Mn family
MTQQTEHTEATKAKHSKASQKTTGEPSPGSRASGPSVPSMTPFQLPPLPYPMTALEPYISARTLEFHHGKHHKAYVTALNRLVAGTPMGGLSLEEVMIRSRAKADLQGSIFNNAAQAWNHAFFWSCMRPDGGGPPKGELGRTLTQSFGGFLQFQEQFKQAALAQFGSGWVWLILDAEALAITSTPNAANPPSRGTTALLTCDVWEHAYYLDYQNRRGDFVQTFLDHLIDWDFVARNLALGRDNRSRDRR